MTTTSTAARDASRVDPGATRSTGGGSRLERGATTGFIVLMIIVLFAFAGLVYDGGRILTAKREAADVASGAARAGAQQVDIDSVRSGQAPTLDGPAAAAAANAFIGRSGMAGGVSVAPGRITVTVTTTQPMAFLGAIGVGARTITQTATARPVRGLITGET